MWVTIIFYGTTVLFLSMTLAALWHLKWVRRLPELETLKCTPCPASPSTFGQVRCSVVIAARNEEARIEGTVRRLLAQEGVEVEILIVDERSVDRTCEIVGTLLKEDPRVKLLRVEVLPEGWVGKCHACHVGATLASGDWILFTDADCWLKPDVIARAARLADRDGADHVVISPGLGLKSPATRAWHLLFHISISHWYSGVNRDRPKSHIGSGAFNMVRTAAYRQCGGYEALRLTVLDDLKLGQLLVRAKKRTRAFLGVDDVECHWGTTVWSMIKLLEKNYFAALDFKVEFALGLSLGVVLCFAICVLGLMGGGAAGIAAALSPMTLVVPASILARRLGWQRSCAIFVPFMALVYVYALLNSTWVTLRASGVRWRDTFYSLEALRAGRVR